MNRSVVLEFPFVPPELKVEQAAEVELAKSHEFRAESIESYASGRDRFRCNFVRTQLRAIIAGNGNFKGGAFKVRILGWLRTVVQLRAATSHHRQPLLIWSLISFSGKVVSTREPQ